MTRRQTSWPRSATQPRFDKGLSDSQKAQLLDEIAEHMPVMITAQSSDPLEVLYVSAGWEALTGLPVQKLLDDPMAWLAVVHPDDRDYAIAEYQASLERRPGGGRDVRILSADGTIRWINSWPCPVLDESGTPIRMVSLTFEVTERKVIEARLRDEQLTVEQKLRSRSVALERTERELRLALEDLRRDQTVTAKVMNRHAKLTPREAQVLDLVVQGSTTLEIAESLGIAAPTVKVHRGKVMKKMEVESVAELVALVVRAGITTPK